MVAQVVGHAAYLGRGTLWQLASQTGEVSYYLHYAIKPLDPKHRSPGFLASEELFEGELLSLFDRWIGEEEMIEALLDQIEVLVHGWFAKAAVLNLFLAEVNREKQEAKLWFQDNYEAFFWCPQEPSLVVPGSGLRPLGLPSGILPKTRSSAALVWRLPADARLVVWSLDEDALHEWGLPSVIKELWDHLLEEGTWGELEDSVFGRSPVAQTLPLFCIRLFEGSSEQ